ncbi:uncharacterized protein A4U43_C04F310 [Asparagus officinalis]|uniref:Ubiquitin-like domain-containing protein n=1 Tax=Asparagus officinalis TaxID=4686 RepID=A0A5P1EXN0_ASPOF|nr:uncharacterized protein A4U43_C04F310 [Asparagus officinalis]
MIEVVLNDRLGKKVRVKCNEDDTIGDLKKLVAAQTGTRSDKIRIQKWSGHSRRSLKVSLVTESSVAWEMTCNDLNNNCHPFIRCGGEEDIEKVTGLWVGSRGELWIWLNE